jgi:hypothetical protein
MTSNVTMQLLKYRRHFKRLFAGPGTLETAAYRREIIVQEERTNYPPLICLNGQLERVTGAPKESTVAHEIESATRLDDVHAPTIAYHFKDVALLDGSVYCGRMRYFLGKLKAPDAVKPLEIDRAALVSSYYGVKYFGHWLRDDCTSHLLAEDLGIPSLCLPGPSGVHTAGYKSLFNQCWKPTFRASIGHLTIFSDYHHNSLRLRRYERLREVVKAHFPRGHRRSLVYLKRGSDGAPRRIANEAEIINDLARSGFVVLDTAQTPLDQMLRTLVDARLVVSLEGSHIAHCLYSIPPDSGILVLQPPDRFSANQRRWTACLGIRSAMVVGRLGEAGYVFDPTEIRRTIDLLDRALAYSASLVAPGSAINSLRRSHI